MGGRFGLQSVEANMAEEKSETHAFTRSRLGNSHKSPLLKDQEKQSSISQTVFMPKQFHDRQFRVGQRWLFHSLSPLFPLIASYKARAIIQ